MSFIFVSWRRGRGAGRAAGLEFQSSAGEMQSWQI